MTSLTPSQTSYSSLFDKLNKYRLKTEWDVVILDMGDDNFILVQKGPEYDAALDLYSEIDVSVVEIPTAITITHEAFQFVQEMIGRIFTIGMSDRLIQDVRVTAMTFEAQKFWKSCHSTSSFLSYPASQDMFTQPDRQRATASREIQDIIITPNVDPPSWPVKDDAIVSPFEPGCIHYSLETVDTSTVESTHILFNKIYNLSIVVDKSKFRICENGLHGFLKLFTEFELVADNVSSHENLKSLFHRRSYESASDTKTKYEAFQCLYGAPKEKETDPTTCCILISTERLRVAKILSDNYDISDSIDDRIKASELYTEIANMIYPKDFNFTNGGIATFKKRISGYFVEHTLKKKRFSDAYYFYGIRRKIREKTAIPSLKELEARRDNEITTYLNA